MDFPPGNSSVAGLVHSMGGRDGLSVAALVMGGLLLTGSNPERKTNTQTVVKSELQIQAEAVKWSKPSMARKGARFAKLIEPGMSHNQVEKLLGNPVWISGYAHIVVYEYWKFCISVSFWSAGAVSLIPGPQGVRLVNYSPDLVREIPPEIANERHH